MTAALSLAKKAELGQVWTPADVALSMAREALKYLPNPCKVLDPSSGPGTFAKALAAAGATACEYACFDVDERMYQATTAAMTELNLHGSAFHADYMREEGIIGKFDFAIMNPPYIRHEAIKSNDKEAYHAVLAGTYGPMVPRRANLFALFLLKGLVDLRPGGILCAIVYDAVTQSAYGQQILRLMSQYAEPLSSTHVSAPFEDVIVDASILVYRKRLTPLAQPLEVKSAVDGLVALDDLLSVRRGTPLSRRVLHLAKPEDVFFDSAAPFFVKQASLDGLIIVPDARAYLSGTEHAAGLLQWLDQRAALLGHDDGTHLVTGVVAPIVFNYYVRSNPRHLWNAPMCAVADNFYAASPKEGFPAELAWLLLNSNRYLDAIMAAARNQGNGLAKLQLFEYKTARVPDWRTIPKGKKDTWQQKVLDLLRRRAEVSDIRSAADCAVKEFKL